MKNVYPPLVILLFLCCPALAQQTPALYWQQQVDYRISATLNDVEHTLDAFETINYYNHSPDTLLYLWIHLWPNAYKNDKTAFSEQKLALGETDFYFSKEDEKGYINRLDFRANNTSLLVEDHPQYIDVVKMYLPYPLAPNSSIEITTPFHVKIPWRFSRLGRINQQYSITQWYPKVALCDAKGWHQMPYLHYGEYFNDFGNYEVDIKLPANYVTAATGMLNSNEEIAWLKAHHKAVAEKESPAKKKELFRAKKTSSGSKATASSNSQKTLHYSATHVSDFAWFASKDFIVKYDTVMLSGKPIDCWNFIMPGEEIQWQHSMQFTKNAIRFYSEQLGDYPFPQVSVVADTDPAFGGMEYPMVTNLNAPAKAERELDIVIAHEIGHNWLQGIIATNERDFPWMDEGMNSYIENKYRRFYYPVSQKRQSVFKILPDNENLVVLDQLYGSHKDQPIQTPSDEYTLLNYGAIVYVKTGLWMEKLEALVGSDTMKTIMQQYYRQWQFRHPYPADFRKLAETYAAQSLDEHFTLLQKTGPLDTPVKRKIAFAPLFNLNETHSKNYIGVAYAFGVNNYDRLQAGLTFHNYNSPANKWQFIATPMYATGSKRITGYARVSYDIFPKGKLQKIQLYTGTASFSNEKARGLNNEAVFTGFTKITPGIYGEWKKPTPLSPITKWFDAKTFIINEQQLELKQRPAPDDAEYYAVRAGTATTIIPQISAGIKADRALYPWSTEFSMQAVKKLIRLSVTGNYFLNYNDKQQGIAARIFFGKIFYTETKTDLLRSQTSRYHFTMYGPNGNQDYTYSNAFAERNQSTGLAGRQIMIRDGGFKYRSDYSLVQPGLSTSGIDFFDNWLAAANFTVDIPDKLNPFSLLPFNVPIKVFADAGTSASPWKRETGLPLFLYSIGLQLPVFNVLNIYCPIIESKEFKEPNSINDPSKPGGPNWWQKRITFSLNLSPVKKIADNIFVL